MARELELITEELGLAREVLVLNGEGPMLTRGELRFIEEELVSTKE